MIQTNRKTNRFMLWGIILPFISPRLLIFQYTADGILMDAKAKRLTIKLIALFLLEI